MRINSVSDCFHPELFNRMERMHGGSSGIGKATRITAHRDRSLVAASDTDDYLHNLLFHNSSSDISFCSLSFLMCKKETKTNSIIGNDLSGCFAKTHFRCRKKIGSCLVSTGINGETIMKNIL